MGLKIIPRSQQITTSWSGGTTTQLYIYPENSSYQERDFLFRISTAAVEVEESVFTKLPGISRQIMILDGTLKLEHSGKYAKILKKFETDSFEGDWETKGFGKVTDFNLMTTGKLQGALSAKYLRTGEIIKFQSDNIYTFIGLYPYKGKLIITLLKENLIVEEKDFLMFFPNNTTCEIHITALENSEIVIPNIH